MRTLSLAAAAWIAALTGSPAQAQTVEEAIVITLQTNPALAARVAQVEAAGERVFQARAQRRAQVGLDINASSGAIWTRQRFLASITDVDQVSNTPVTASLTASQPLWSGGRISAATALADAQLSQALASHAVTETALIQAVVIAYADLARDLAQLDVRNSNVRVLQEQLAAASARFAAGDITLTDVAQVEARLAAGVAGQAQARSRLEVSRATVARLIGQPPTSLTPADLQITVPASLEAASALARRDNPSVMLARLGQDAAGAGVRAARAADNPQASVFVQTNAHINQGFDENRGGSVILGARLNVPFYTAGVGASRTREALANQNAARFAVVDAEQLVIEQVAGVWWALEAARAVEAATRQRLVAASLAFEGAQLEQTVGLRTTLDVLTQAQELREAELAAATARRDVVTASTQLIALTGQLTPEALGLTAVRAQAAVPRDRGAPLGLERPLVQISDRLDAISEGRE